MPNEESWGDYSKLVLKELERLNENYEKMRIDFDNRFKEMNNALSEFKNTEKMVVEHKNWIDRVNDIWSPNQMQQAKNEIYEQKGKWTSVVAILTFVQIIIGIVIALGLKLFK
jgi:chromosome segregation ATPase